MQRGTFIVIDGTDGTGKATQTELFFARAKREGFPMQSFSFPRYNTPTGRTTSQMLHGAGDDAHPRRFDPTAVDPHVASLFFSADRLAAAQEMHYCLQTGKNLVADRYVGSNWGHQGTKFATTEERLAFYRWSEWLEFEQNGIPRPDLNIILHLPAHIALRRSASRGRKSDGHETPEHIARAEQVYLEIGSSMPGFQVLSCVDESGNELSREEVHEKVWALAAATLRKPAFVRA